MKKRAETDHTPLNIVVDTFDKSGKQLGTRTVDMYHFGTRNWLANHLWWATHNGHEVVVKQVPESEVA